MNLTINGELSDVQPKDALPKKFLKARVYVEDTINQAIGNSHYSDAIDLIFLAPIIMQNDNSFFAQIKERKLIKHKDQVADFRLRIDYQKFVSSDDSTREKLLLKNFIDAIRIIGKRLKKRFDGEKLEHDILSLWNLKYSDLESL